MIYLFGIFVFLFGASIGSFLNALEYRLIKKKDIIKGRSACPNCSHQLNFFDLIPIFSFLFLRGHCRYCHQKISWQYPLIEIVTGLLFLLIFLNLFSQFYTLDSAFYIFLLRDWIFTAVMIFVFLYDLKYMLIEDIIVLPAIGLIFLLNLLSGSSIFLIIVGTLISWGFFWLQYFFTKKKGLGEGDLWLGILMGVMFGWPKVLLAIAISYIIGGFISFLLLLLGKKNISSKIPLGPFLAIGSIIILLLGNIIINFYL